jgi:hypothetical protein
MLPNLKGLDLQPHKAQETGEFYALNHDERDSLERETVVEIFSQETPDAGSEQTFRVAKTRNARPSVMGEYDWYSGPELWEWAKTHRLDPLNKQWWYEDWMALRNRHGPSFTIPSWVSQLPKMLSDAGRAAQARTNAGRAAQASQQQQGDLFSAVQNVLNSQSARARRDNPVYGPYNPRVGWLHFGDNARWMRNPWRDGWDIYVGGAKRYAVFDVDNLVMFFEGPAGQERHVTSMNNGFFLFMKGARGQEHLVRVMQPDGSVWFYEGPKGQEHHVRGIRLNGREVFYEGPKGQERGVRAKNQDSGWVQFFEGPKGQERTVRAESRLVRYYEGPQGRERIMRSEVNGVPAQTP